MSNELNPSTGGLPLPPPSGAPIDIPKPKKPIFRKWWFWVLVALGVLIVISAMSSGGDSSDTSTTMEEAVESGPVDPQSLTGGNLKDAIEALQSSGVPDEGILVVDSGAVISADQSVYDTQGFSIENLGSDEFQQGQTVCGVEVKGAGAADQVIVLWAESSCADGEQRLADLAAAGAAETAASTEESAEASTEPSAEPSASETMVDEPMAPDAFLILAGGDIADFAKDLEDMAKAASEGGIFRVMGNSLELSFNLGQLQSYTPPTEIEKEWNAGLNKLSKRVDAIDEAIAGDSSAGALNKAINSAANALLELDAVLDKIR